MASLKGEFGVTGLKQYGGLVEEHWITSLNTSSKRIRVYDEMYRYDPTASAMIKTTEMFMCASQPRVEAASHSAADKEAAEFLESCLTDMTKSWQSIMSDIVLFLPYGFFDCEIVYWKRDGSKSQFDDGRIGWRKWGPRHPTTVDSWKFDEHGGIEGMWQLDPNGHKTVWLPVEKLLHFTTTGMGKNSPEGISVLEGAYQSWFYAKNLTIQEAIIVERMSGTPFIGLPEGASTDSSSDSDLERAKQIVRNIKTAEDMGLTLPYGFEFGYKVPPSGPALQPGDIITRHRRDLARALAMDFIMLGGGDQGSWAMHKDKSQLYIRSLNAFLKKIADVINRHGVTRLFELNAFPNITGLPQVYFTPISKIDIGDFADVIAGLFNSGALSYNLDTENAVRREVGLPEIDEPGITFKPPMPLDENMQAPQPAPEPEPEEEPEEEEPDEEEPEDDEEGEMSEFADVGGGMAQSEARAYAATIASQIMNDYDEFARDLSASLAAEDDEEDWEAEVDVALLALAVAMRRRLRDGLLYVWDTTTGSDPSIEGMSAVLSELEFQDRYIRDSLLPDIKERVLEERRKLALDAVAAAVVAMALLGALAAFRYRASRYSGAVYKLWANHARPRVIFEILLKRSGGNVQLDPITGKLSGDGLEVRQTGPDGERSCFDCLLEIEQGWRPVHLGPPPIGSLQCDGSCRCWLEYKYRGRIYR